MDARTVEHVLPDANLDRDRRRLVEEWHLEGDIAEAVSPVGAEAVVEGQGDVPQRPPRAHRGARADVDVELVHHILQDAHLYAGGALAISIPLRSGGPLRHHYERERGGENRHGQRSGQDPGAKHRGTLAEPVGNCPTRPPAPPLSWARWPSKSP